MNFFFKSSTYSLKKSKRVLRQTFHLLKKKKKQIDTNTISEFKDLLLNLQIAILACDKEQSNLIAKQIESLTAAKLKKTSWDHFKELIFALSFALIIAILVRQMWFEFYEIPSGSMRPTFKEQDRLVVSKTTFGINIPLEPNEFYFDPDLVKRNNIAIFTGENMDIRDVDTLYFYLFPGKKQYIKRLIAKPGDVLYFYGGLIYGMDEKGNNISQELQPALLDKIDHIPFIDFDRKLVLPPAPVNGIYSPAFIYQMNEPVVKLYMAGNNQVTGEMIVPPQIHQEGAPKINNYRDLWGFKNYGMVRLLTKEQIKTQTDQNLSQMEEGLLYLEIRHNPTIDSVKLIRDEYGRLRPTFGLSTSFIPLQERHLREIFKNMYTARFEVKNGIAFRYGLDPKLASKNIFSVRLPHVPDGVYEFYHGKAHKILWQGWTKTLSEDHPIYQFDSTTVQLFFNLGIEWDTRFSPQVKNQKIFPARYTYFRNHALYLLGAPILQQTDTTLIAFNQRETEKKKLSNIQHPYYPFEDTGPPVNVDGSLNTAFIAQNGLVIPPKMYLMLGDNHAMSSDSRDFGFVPQTNLRGGPDFIFWPPGSRFGSPLQPGYPFFNLPRTIVWILAGIGILLGTIYWMKRNKLPLKIEEL